MKTIRNHIEGFIYPHLEYFTDMVYKNGVDTEFLGIRVLDDRTKFTQGMLVNAASTLYAYYVRNNDPRANEVLDRLHFFIDVAVNDASYTWGKLSILRGFNTLRENGLLSHIKKDATERVKLKTEYDDFFDKETLELKGMATNYYQVAMACAGFREALGWENEGYSEKIGKKLIGILEKEAGDGWMDDEVPYGRFDRYSIVLASEFVDSALSIGLDIPATIRGNLRRALDTVLFMVNKHGDGITYGRSVTCHGDSTVPEVISSAAAIGVLNESEYDMALAYTQKTLEKITNFWYDKERRTFNLWFDGRSTNRYRSVARILEVNIDMAMHLFTVLQNFERAGLADKEIDTSIIPSPAEWTHLKVEFIKTDDAEKSLIIGRRGDTLLFLPFVGTGKNWGRRNAYYPFPAVPKLLEASPVSEVPFMLPEYQDEQGNKYRPCQFYEKVDVTTGADSLTVTATGVLANYNTTAPVITTIPFTSTYTICGPDITVKIEVDTPLASAEMITGSSVGGATVTPVGFDTVTDIDKTGDINFVGIHTNIVNTKLATTKNTACLGYTVSLNI